MAVQHSELTPVELEFFADESKRVCLLHVMKGDRMMAEKVKLSSAEHPGVWTCFRCEVVFNQEIHLHYHQNICLYNLTPRTSGGVNLTPSAINVFVTQKIKKKLHI